MGVIDNKGDYLPYKHRDEDEMKWVKLFFWISKVNTFSSFIIICFLINFCI